VALPDPVRSGNRILCVGALTMDTIYRLPRLPDGPGKFLPTDVMEIAEGMAASAAASCARLGGDVALWASVGDDPVGAR
jgi:sulfofructose kinase